MRVCLMVEGQEGVSWDQWLALARACEGAGLDALFRSDHYLSVQGRTDRGSLDAWATISALGAVTRRLRLGTMVSPATFRHPSVLAKMAATADQVSGGRVEVGMGAGWLEAEHTAYGFPFPSEAERLDVLEEQIEIVHRSWHPGPFDFHGRHYRLASLDALPKPVQRPHPNLIVGGRGGRRSAEVAARWADEYNTVFATADAARRRRRRVAEAWERAGRDPATLVFSVMTGSVLGRDRDEVRRRAEAVIERSGRSGPVDAWLDRVRGEWVVGTAEEAIEHLRGLEAAGVERVMLQHLLHEDLEVVDLLGEMAAKLAG
jgi:F420-dependent oxidoreductase-like protein